MATTAIHLGIFGPRTDGPHFGLCEGPQDFCGEGAAGGWTGGGSAAPGFLAPGFLAPREGNSSDQGASRTTNPVLKAEWEGPPEEEVGRVYCFISCFSSSRSKTSCICEGVMV